jgi:SNF2 family DNA or RNA helicase
MALTPCCFIFCYYKIQQFIIVCPSSLVANWANEFDKWIGRAGSPKRVVLRKGGEDGRAQIRAYCSKMKHGNNLANGQVLILSYDLLRLNANEFQNMQQQVSFALLVVDEGHRLKNTGGSNTMTVLEAIPCDARLCITATPVQNNLGEFYALANFVCPGILGDLAMFRSEYERPISTANNKSATQQELLEGKTQSLALDAITKQFMLRRLQKDVLKSMLLPRMEALLFCKPATEQCDVYKRITHDHGNTNGEASMADALTKLTALRKLCLHPTLCSKDLGSADTSAATSIVQSGKLVVLDALLQSIREKAPDDKVVVVSNFTSALSLVETMVLQPRNMMYSRLDGTTAVQNRQSLVDSFNRASPQNNFCFLLSSKAGGVGLNLIGANRLVMLDADWNPALDIQAMGRIYRQGQTKASFIYRFFTCGTIEEVIYQRQSQKGNLATFAVDGSGTSKSRFTKDELKDCFTLKVDCDCDTKNKLGLCWPQFTGADGLEALGCTDAPLLAIASSVSASLGYIHIVDEDAIDASGSDSQIDLLQESMYDSDDEEEVEFK